MKTQVAPRRAGIKPPERKQAHASQSNALKAKLVRIGNSHGVRLPKAVIEQAGLTGDVEISVRDNEVVIRSPSNDNPRAGWDAAFKKAFDRFGREEPDEHWEEWRTFPNEFDEKESA